MSPPAHLPRFLEAAEMRLPLVLTTDPDLLDDLIRLAAAGGTDVEVAPDAAAARLRSGEAPLVVIGADQVTACDHARLPRGARVIAVGRYDLPLVEEDIASRLGIEHIATLPIAQTWLVEVFAQAQQPVSRARVLAVVGGRGGAGASILATGLAVTAVTGGRRTLLVDADPLSGGLDLVLGWEDVKGLRWPALAPTSGRVDPPKLLGALPSRGDLVLLSFDRDLEREGGPWEPIPLAAMEATLDAARRGRDAVVIDVPRRLDDASVLALEAADRTLLLVPAELRAVASARRIRAMLAAHCDELAVVVRRKSPGRLRTREVAGSLSLPLAGELVSEPAMCLRLEQGEAPTANGRGPLAELCRDLIADLFDEKRTEDAA